MVSTSLLSIVAIIASIIIAWIIISIPLYLAGKLISGKRTTFGKAMLAALIAPLVTLFFFFIVSVGLAAFLGPFAVLIGAIIAILALSYVFGSIFDTSLLGGFGIAILATIITYIVTVLISVIFLAMFGVSVPTVFSGRGPPFY